MMHGGNMYILHIETATKICSVAISQGDTLLGYKDLEEGMNHAARLTPLIEEVIRSHGVQMEEIGAVSVSSGPGSYTGLRVGGSTAKAIAYSRNIPLVPVPTLLALATAGFEKYPEVGDVCPMLDARREEVYTAHFSRQQGQIRETQTLILSGTDPFGTFLERGPVLFCGDGAFKVRELPVFQRDWLVDEAILCSARHLVLPASRMLKEDRTAEAMHFVPFYLKPPNITQAKKII